ncbi:hypothetical protein [Shewanella mangrovisoli]|uniref:hypothetical protein n=1 Tax=Shewanella mangrovisoli TaxID=2864211 RepID=UPI0035B9C2C1
MNSVSFMIPLPIAAFIMFVGGAIYSIYTFRKVTSKIALNKGTSIHQAYRNYSLLGAVGFLPSYPPLDPDREMEGLAKNWVVKLYSRKKANLMYARILDCIDRHRFMLNSMSTSEDVQQR